MSVSKNEIDPDFPAESMIGKMVTVEYERVTRRKQTGRCVDLNSGGVIIEFESRGKRFRVMFGHGKFTKMSYITGVEDVGHP